MDKQNNLEEILIKVKEGTIDIDEAKDQLKTYENLGFARLDFHRENRQGFPEVIYGEGKTAFQIIEIIKGLQKRHRRILGTRICMEKAEIIMEHVSDIEYSPLAETILWKKANEPEILYEGYIAVVSAGTSDLKVAEEAAETIRAMGCQTIRICDVGVAGIHRLLDQLETIQNAAVSVVVAGMEGALPSAVGGLVDHPVIAVPTSIGYGANFGGLSALLSMLNSCASGISVVNIDNGFGGGYNAALIHRMGNKKRRLENENSLF
ncbi:nickel pincer cofactor biosynthesis protein LarB [Bacillus sp. CMF12]|uniref:nickel pincer cofactor biosynthesis protein LarB n=1 Tax=Bacillaceae TaxID=186817 RepID=UPI001FB56032|nr:MULTISPECIES: nickel pincer cofactor biosynthesis protein LarB [Bacillaceae]UOE53136.1 nickel pincer cofactor biosynthesis protein LarB [Cytobacillus oceanisediminis]USK52345.1 nickel pincer cofactor biosynthesis protein LarB [Bacillus sp. CMF12]